MSTTTSSPLRTVLLSLSNTRRICSPTFFEAVCLRSSGGHFRFGVDLSVPDKALGLHTHKIKPVPPPAGILTNYQLPSHGISCETRDQTGDEVNPAVSHIHLMSRVLSHGDKHGTPGSSAYHTKSNLAI